MILFKFFLKLSNLNIKYFVFEEVKIQLKFIFDLTFISLISDIDKILIILFFSFKLGCFSILSSKSSSSIISIANLKTSLLQSK